LYYSNQAKTMKFKSPVYSQASGSIAGITYSHNRGGMYTRRRATPTNPNSPAQQAVRTAMANLVTNWTVNLTASNRNVWNAYANNTPVVNRLGDPILLTGQQMFLRSNIPRVQEGFDYVASGPTVDNLGLLSPISFNSGSSTTALQIDFDNSDVWAAVDGGYLFIQVSRGQNPSKNFFKGPFRSCDPLAGDTVTPPSSPYTVTGAPFSWSTGQRVFLRARASTYDGRLTTAQIIYIDL
jgi:hypothetical protein